MIKCVTAALGLVVSMTVGAGLAAAHDKAEKPSVTGETIDEGDDAEMEGTLEIEHEDREDGSSVDRHFLSTHDGKRVSLEGVQHHDLLTGDLVRVRGVRAGQKLQLKTKTAEALQVLQSAPLSHAFGQQKIAVFLASFSNSAPRISTAAVWKQYMETEIEPFFRENSYGQTWFETDVFGWYTMPFTNDVGCPDRAIKSYVDLAATAAGINLSGYTRLVYFFPWTPACPYAGLYSGSLTPGGGLGAKNIYLNGTAGGVLSHELGHSFGLTHAHAYLCPPGIILDPICGIRDKGDSTDIFGGGGSGVNYRVTGHFNPLRKQALGWLDYTNVTSNGTYTIDLYEAQGTAAPKALMIPITKGRFAGLSFSVAKHPSTPMYELQGTTRVSAGDCSGVFVHVGASGNNSLLLDMTPETPQPIAVDSCLNVGKTFTDPPSGITIGLVSMSDTSATIMVDRGGTGPSCTRSAPSVTASPGQGPAVQSGTMVTYNVSVTNTDSAGCSASSFTLAATAPTTSWQKSFGASSVTAGPGATVSTTLRITSPIVPTGSYAIVSAATRTTASPLSGSGSMHYNVAPDGPPAPPGPTFTDTFDRPDSPVLGNGWSVMAGSLMLQSGEARNQPNSTFSLAVQASPIGATQTVAASFASTNNNSAPRFGVVVRYRDPQNYYLCYRQVGGSSVVRIAKVQNGAETVLKSVGIGNPALNASSTVSCQASGSTLTLRVDGVTLSMTDGTFSTGSAGYAISTKQGGSHRADNFTANVQ